MTGQNISKTKNSNRQTFNKNCISQAHKRRTKEQQRKGTKLYTGKMKRGELVGVQSRQHDEK